MTDQNNTPEPQKPEPTQEKRPDVPSSTSPQKSQQPVPPQTPGEYPQPADNISQLLGTDDSRELKSVRNLIVAASIAGPVSLFFGGVLLSSVGLVCGFLGLRKLKKLSAKNSSFAEAASRVLKSVYVAMAISGVALILNAVSLWIMYPIVMEALETGNYDSILSDSLNAATGSGTSTWG